MVDYLKTTDLNGELEELWKLGVRPGEHIGWTLFNDTYTVKLGTTTYVNGISSHGKTIFILNILVNLSKSKGWKHAIWSPETGKIVNQLSEITHTWSGKNMRKETMSMEEMYQYQTELSEYFYFMDIDSEHLTIENYMKVAKKLIDEQKVNTFLLDPWNELIHDFSEFSGREDKYLLHWLGIIRRFAVDNNVHFFIIAHPKEPARDKDGVIKAPTIFDFAGGHAWSARAMNIICVHRPKFDEEKRELPYHNQSTIYIQKVKPKEVGDKGIINLWFDKEKNRFYDKDSLGNPVFSNVFNKEYEL